MLCFGVDLGSRSHEYVGWFVGFDLRCGFGFIGDAVRVLCQVAITCICVIVFTSWCLIICFVCIGGFWFAILRVRCCFRFNLFARVCLSGVELVYFGFWCGLMFLFYG